MFRILIVEDSRSYRESLKDIDGSGLELTKKIKTMLPQVTVAMLTTHDGPEYREAAIRYGATYYLTKGNATREKIQNLIKSSASEVR